MISNNSTTTSINATTSSSKRLSGLMSGLDTDTLVKQMTMGTQNKIDKAGQRKQLTVWRQDSYRETTKALSEFRDKYLASASSTSSILNSYFFNTSSIKNTSSALNISGNADAAKNMVVTQITQLAKQAGFTSTHKVSTEMLTTGTVKSGWAPNAIAGTSVTLNYGGKDYKISIDSDFVYDATDNVSKIVEELNNSISKIDDLNGKIHFEVNSGKVAISKIDASASDFHIKEGTSNLLSGLGLTAGTSDVSSILGTDVKNDDFFRNTLAAGSELVFNVGGKQYNLKISSDVALSPKLTSDDLAAALKSAFDSAISSNSDLSGKITTSITDGVISFSGGTIVGGSQNLLDGLQLTKQGDGSYINTDPATKKPNSETLVKRFLGDTLAGATLTFSLNGLSRNVTFNESEKASYSTPADLVSYLNTKLKAAYGDGKITVTESDGVISFQTTDPSSIFSVESSDAVGVLGKNGALHVYAGDSNRINPKKMLEDLNDGLTTKITPNALGKYEVTINGKQFTFSKTDTLANILSKINNDADANVNILYSSITDNFTVTAKTGGQSSKVDISDVSGNLAAALFGTSGADYTVQSGQDAKLTMSFNGDASSAKEIIRSENNFTIDGVNISLLNTDNSVTKDNPIRFTAENKTDDLYTKLKTFVDDYNTIVSSLYSKISESKPKDESYPPLTDDQKKEMTQQQIDTWNAKAKQGLMQGDFTLNDLNTGLRQAMTNMVTSVNSALFQIGVTTKEYGKDGKLVIDEAKLKKALSDNPEKVASLFTGEDGIASRLKSVIDRNIGTFGGGGVLIAKAGQVESATTDQSALTKLIKEYDSQIKTLKDRLKIQQNQYYNKFTQLETYINRMNAQSGVFANYLNSGS